MTFARLRAFHQYTRSTAIPAFTTKSEQNVAEAAQGMNARNASRGRSYSLGHDKVGLVSLAMLVFIALLGFLGFSTRLSRLAAVVSVVFTMARRKHCPRKSA
jgi:hypothetical protein